MKHTQKYKESENPWTIESEQVVYDNPWIQVQHFDVKNPGGGKGIYGKVHFKNYAIGIIPLDEELNIWLVGQYRFPLNQYSWEIPEGGGKLDQDILESAKRELQEECGIIAQSWTPILEMHLSNSVSDELGKIFLARFLQHVPSNPDENEELQVKKIPFQEGFDMVMNGKITDSLSVAGILKLKILLDNGKFC